MNSKVTMVLRIILGLILVIFGANKFGHFMPSPELTGDAATFMGSLAGAGYFTILGVLEIFIGLLLILNKWVPFALVLLAPLVVNFLIFHLTYDMGGILPASIVTILSIVLIYANWNKFKTLF
ncbi:MAG TPA: DoxX protein [Oceanospirillales bacterium]|nr:DoxX protein [Oceanospirillales bacterium]